MQYGTGHWNAKILGNHGAVVSLIALASWAPEAVKVRLTIDWAAPGQDLEKTTLRAAALKDVQEAAAYRPDDAIPIQPGRGWLLVAAETRKTRGEINHE